MYCVKEGKETNNNNNGPFVFDLSRHDICCYRCGERAKRFVAPPKYIKDNYKVGDNTRRKQVQKRKVLAKRSRRMLRLKRLLLLRSQRQRKLPKKPKSNKEEEDFRKQRKPKLQVKRFFPKPPVCLSKEYSKKVFG